MDQNEILKGLKEQFAMDAPEHVISISNSLVNLTSDFSSTFDLILRELHTLKGDANVVGHAHFSEFIHWCEDRLLPFRHRTPLDTSIVPLFEIAISDLAYELESYLAALKDNLDSPEMRKQYGNSVLVLAPTLIEKFGEQATGSHQAVDLGDWGQIPAQNITAEPPAPEIQLPTEIPAAQESVPTPLKAQAEVVVEKFSKTFLFAGIDTTQLLFPIENVEEVIMAREITPLPSKKKMFKGVILFRELTVPVLNLPEFFSASAEPASYFVIIERNGERLALPVSSARHVGTVEQPPQPSTAIEGSQITKALLIHNEIASLWIDVDKLFNIGTEAA